MKRTLITLALAGAAVLGGTAAEASVIATFNYNGFIQSGSVLNQHSQNIVGFQIDFVADTGVPASPIWELPPIGSLGNPLATFTNSPHPEGAFTAGWSGLNIGNGSSFIYSQLDFGGWNGVFVDETIAPSLRGDEIATIFFADGSSVSALFAAGASGLGGTLVFDDANLVTAPEPATLTILGLGVAGWAFRRKRAA